ncbi:hypothetical protein ACJIZ3_016797 [Penstemon smallii]|uniref:DYW domain-containing protein n=1 Tax=Penstemon smallii TaxID=265156 RepID=A0ABD3SUG6_9LAMI
MAALFQHMNFNFASISMPPITLKKTHLLKISKKSTNLKESFLSLTKKLVSSNPNISLDEAYSLVLDHCTTQKSLSIGKQIHTHIEKRNCAYDLLFLCTKIVLMYGKCGSLLDAENLFDEMLERSIFSYNALLGAYVSNGDLLKAIELYADMRFLDITVDAHTCSSVLKACAGVKHINCGREIHGLGIKFGLFSNGVFVNSLLSMYARCNDLNAAVLLFDRMCCKEDVVLWNLMISAYATNGMGKEALSVFGEMQSAGVTPSTYTFVAALQACEELLVGMQLHALLMKYCLYFDRYVANALVVMYSRCCRTDEATRVFFDMGQRDNVSWNSMLSAYVQNGLYDESLDFFREITCAGHQPDQVSVISVLSACAKSKNLLNGMEVHAFALKNGMELDIQVGNTIIDMYAKCSKASFMDSAFQRIPEKDYISWTTVIAGNVQNHCYMKALQLFKEVQMEGIDIDKMMIESVLLACRGLKHISIAKEIYNYILRRELSDIVLQNTFVDVYGECGKVDYARNIFDLIEDKNVVSWTSMIACYVQNGLANEALKLSTHLVKAGIELDSIALLSILSAAANVSALRKGKEIHGYLLRKCLHLQESVASSLVDMYASCGALDDSYNVFNCVKDKDLVLWTSVINAYGMHGRGLEAIKLFIKMEAESVLPDSIAFLALLYACSHSALVEEGKRFFNIMQHKYGLEPWPEHYACLVDLLGRANYLEEAYELVKSMKMEPTAAIWCAILGACRTHSNMEIGEIAARKLLEVDPENPGNYVLISNIYAAAKRWDDVEEVRMRMKVKGLKKDPACSWIEIRNKVHTFISRDRSHPNSDEIYEKLSQITKKLERDGGYKAQTSYVLHNVEEKEKVKMLHSHSERLALAYGILSTSKNVPIRVTKNLRVCGDCHTFTKLVSKFLEREIIVRDANRFHHFRDGICSCGDYW